MSDRRPAATRIGLLGAGAIASCVAEKLGMLDRVKCVGFVSRDEKKADAFGLRYGLAQLSSEQLIAQAEIIIEAAHPSALIAFAPGALERGRTLIVLSANGLIACPSLADCRLHPGGRLILASGALAGLDAIAAARVGGILRVRLKTSKPPRAFPDFAERPAPTAPVLLFSGTAREAGAKFPRNTNVAASLALAAFDIVTGPDRVEVEIWADPDISANIHEVHVESTAGTMRASIVNHPLAENAATSRLAAQSAVAALEKLVSRCTFA